MPNHKVSDTITDQEIAFAHLVLSGTMTDRDAAQAAGLNPDTAAGTKAEPRVRAYILKHRVVQQQPVEQETDGLCPLIIGREQVLRRLWEFATMSPEMTKGSITGQVKALSIIVAMEGLIPDRRAASADNKPVPPAAHPAPYRAAWLRARQAINSDPEPNPPFPQEDDGIGFAEPEPAPGPVADVPPNPSESPSASLVSDSETKPWESYAPAMAFPRDTRVPFSIKKNPFA